jgi:hypothetical protein
VFPVFRRLGSTSALIVLWLGACRPAEPPSLPSGPPAPESTAPPAYTPGLGEIMTLTQMRHLKLWLAADAQNWDLASYEVDEIEEGFADAIAFHPQHKNAPRPLAELTPEFMGAPIAALRAAIAERDAAKLAGAYDALTEGCNGCHRAAGFAFNRVVRPAANPYANQVFAAPSEGAR